VDDLQAVAVVLLDLELHLDAAGLGGRDFQLKWALG
jgi:hypothetical protein